MQKAWEGGDTNGKQHDGSRGNPALRDVGHEGQPGAGEVDELSREGTVGRGENLKPKFHLLTVRSSYQSLV